MANIDELNLTFTDGITCIDATLLNTFQDKINEVIRKVNDEEPPVPITVDTPTITINNGVVTITCLTENATIRYTTDGSTPTSSSGTIYSEAFTPASETTQIKAIAYKSGMNNSSVASKSYTPSSQYSQEAQAVINKFSNMSSANQDKVADFVDALVSAGVYSKINYLMIPTVAGSVSEGVQNVLSSVAPPSISGAEIANGGLRLTSPICIDLTDMMVNSPDYANYAIGFSGIIDSGATGTQRRALTFGTVPTQGTSPGADKQYIIQDVNSGMMQYHGYGRDQNLVLRSVIRHDNTTKKESYMTSGSIVSSDDTKTIDVATGMYLGSWIDDISTSVYRCVWRGTYRLLVFTKLLSDTELTALENAIQSFLS